MRITERDWIAAQLKREEKEYRERGLLRLRKNNEEVQLNTEVRGQEKEKYV